MILIKDIPQPFKEISSEMSRSMFFPLCSTVCKRLRELIEWWSILLWPFNDERTKAMRTELKCTVLYIVLNGHEEVAFVHKYFVDWCVVRLLLIGSWFQLVRLSDGYHVLMRFCSELVYITSSVEWIRANAYIERSGSMSVFVFVMCGTPSKT